MNTKLILVEGIPGAGKTTTARKIKEELESQGKKVNLYEEGMSHPADMAWQAYLSESEFNQFVEKWLSLWEEEKDSITKDELRKRIEQQARYEFDHVILAYTKIDFPDDKYWRIASEVECKELGDGRSSFHDFKNVHLSRWTRFAKEAEQDEYINIFDCAFLQNHLVELMSVYMKTDEEIIKYMSDLIETVKSLNPQIVYIKPTSVEKVINQAAEERKSSNLSSKDWIDWMADWVAYSNYGKNHKLTGREGVISFNEDRLRLDELVISKLEIPVIVIERN